MSAQNKLMKLCNKKSQTLVRIPAYLADFFMFLIHYKVYVGLINIYALRP